MAGIPIAAVVNWPKVLTNKSWQKAKGVIAKAAGETGVGAALDAAEKLHKAIDFAQLEPPAKNEEQLEAAIKASKAYYQKNVTPLRESLRNVVSVAEAAQKKLAKVPLSKDAVKALKEIATTADQFAVSLKSLDLDAYIEKMRAEIKKNNDVALTVMKNGQVAKVIKLVTDFGKNPSYKDWPKQPCRALSASLANLDEPWAKKHAATYKNIFKSFDENGLGFMQEPDEENLTRMKRVASMLLEDLAQLQKDMS